MPRPYPPKDGIARTGQASAAEGRSARVVEYRAAATANPPASAATSGRPSPDTGISAPRTTSVAIVLVVARRRACLRATRTASESPRVCWRLG